MEVELLSATELAEICRLPDETVEEFTDLRECSEDFQKCFMHAWQIIYS